MPSPTYHEFVKALVKPPETIKKSLTDHKVDLLHAVLGIAGEAGELVDAIKKHVIYNKPLDVPNVVEELGDLEFYMEQMRSALGLNRDAILSANRDKLALRYKDTVYSDRAAQERADKAI